MYKIPQQYTRMKTGLMFTWCHVYYINMHNWWLIGAQVHVIIRHIRNKRDENRIPQKRVKNPLSCFRKYGAWSYKYVTGRTKVENETGWDFFFTVVFFPNDEVIVVGVYFISKRSIYGHSLQVRGAPKHPHEDYNCRSSISSSMTMRENQASNMTNQGLKKAMNMQPML